MVCATSLQTQQRLPSLVFPNGGDSLVKDHSNREKYLNAFEGSEEVIPYIISIHVTIENLPGTGIQLP
jgi:hypothetical protein